MTRKSLIATPPEIVDRLLHAAGNDTVLVGGQALGIWAQRYGLALPKKVSAISKDADFLVQSPTARHSVEGFAKAMGGKTIFPSRLALTALVGQAVLDASESEYINVDVIFKVAGLSAAEVMKRATRVDLESQSFLLMHPLHVLRSRLSNLHTLADKKNEEGAMQLGLAIQVAREFLRDAASRASAAENAAGRSPIQKFVSEIERLAVEDAGRKVAARWKLHVADAIDPSLIPAGPFWTKRWPALRSLMSEAYAVRFTPPLPFVPSKPARKAR